MLATLWRVCTPSGVWASWARPPGRSMPCRWFSACSMIPTPKCALNRQKCSAITISPQRLISSSLCSKIRKIGCASFPRSVSASLGIRPHSSRSVPCSPRMMTRIRSSAMAESWAWSVAARRLKSRRKYMTRPPPCVALRWSRCAAWKARWSRRFSMTATSRSSSRRPGRFTMCRSKEPCLSSRRSRPIPRSRIRTFSTGR